MIYLDYAASTPLLPSVKKKLLEVIDIYGNPSSLHEQGYLAKNLITEAKDIISNKLNCENNELYFTSGATMSNNIVLGQFDKLPNSKVFISDIEHEDIQIMADKLGFTHISVDSNGYIDTEDIEDILDQEDDATLKLFSIQGANGEIGTVQNIKAISKVIHRYPNAYLHIDATQYIPYFKLDVQKLKIDALSMSGQKIGCIKGVGLLYLNHNLKLPQYIYGEQGFIGGTENVPGIACLGQAFLDLQYDNDNLKKLSHRLYKSLDGEVKLIGSEKNRLPNNVNILFKDCNGEVLVDLLNQAGICCSTGSACSSSNGEPSHTLLAIGLTPEEANSCIRFTLGRETTKEEIDTVARIVNFTIRNMQKE